MSAVESAARILAAEHLADDEGARSIFWFPAEDEIRLVQVSASANDTGEILPFRFVADPPDIPVPYVVILLSPGDWSRVEAGELQLPEEFGEHEEVWP